MTTTASEQMSLPPQRSVSAIDTNGTPTSPRGASKLANVSQPPLKKALSKPKVLSGEKVAKKKTSGAGRKRSESSTTNSSSSSTQQQQDTKDNARPQSPRAPLSPRQRRMVEKLAQPKRTRSKRYRLEKSHSKSGFGSGSARDLFFGMIPGEGAKKQYLQHDELEKNNAAQSVFRSKTLINDGRMPFLTNNTETTDVDLQHSEEILEQHDKREDSAPFGTTEGKFKIYDYYHSMSGTNEMIAPGSYFRTPPAGSDPSSSRNSGAFIDLSETPAKQNSPRHPNSLLFQQQHKNFRSSNDVLAIAALKKGSSLAGGGSGLSRMSGKASQSTMALPLHLVRKNSLGSPGSKNSSREGSTLTSPRKKTAGGLVSPRRRAVKRSSKKANEESGANSPLTPITPLTPTSDMEEFGNDEEDFAE